MNIKTRKEIIADTIRTIKIVLITIVLILLIGWLSFGTVAMFKVKDLQQKVEYYQEKEEKQKSSRTTIEVNGQTYVLIEDGEA